nr:MAG TPA: hypothetical protein [Caudoviricetes sp.]
MYILSTKSAKSILPVWKEIKSAYTLMTYHDVSILKALPGLTDCLILNV